MIDSIKLYGKYLNVLVRSQLQYRSVVLMLSLGDAIITSVEFWGILILFSRFGMLKGWAQAEVALFFGTVNLAYGFSQMVGRGFDKFNLQVLRGDFDRVLSRPRSTVLQVLGSDFMLTKIGRITLGGLVMSWSLVQLNVAWTVGNVLLLCFSLISCFFLFLGILVLQATTAFWALQGIEFFNVLTSGGVETVRYPLSIYNRWLQGFFIVIIPLGCTQYFPLIAFLGKNVSLHVPLWCGWICPLAGIIFFLLTLTVWRFGVRHYCSTGS